jgi:hypothetical protein
MKDKEICEVLVESDSLYESDLWSDWNNVDLSYHYSCIASSLLR